MSSHVVCILVLMVMGFMFHVLIVCKQQSTKWSCRRGYLVSTSPEMDWVRYSCNATDHLVHNYKVHSLLWLDSSVHPSWTAYHCTNTQTWVDNGTVWLKGRLNWYDRVMCCLGRVSIELSTFHRDVSWNLEQSCTVASEYCICTCIVLMSYVSLVYVGVALY